MSEQAIPHNQEPDPQFAGRFIDAIGSVQEYNKRHTGIGGAMKGIIGIMLANIGAEEEEAAQPQVSQADEAQMERELVQILQADELAGMGVTLFDMSAPGIKKFEIDEEQERPQLPSALFMLITDKDKFQDTLQRLNPTEEQKEQTANGVASLLDSSIQLIQAAYPHKAQEGTETTAEPEILQAVVHQQLDMFMDLVPTLAAKGFNQGYAYETLAEYAARYASGILPEYREAEASGLLAGGDRFGPAAWVRDMGAKTLLERWTGAFELLERLRDREEPTPFFTELFDKLRADFDSARNWLDTVDQYDDISYEKAYAEYTKAHADHEAKLKETLEHEPTYDELYGEGAPQAPEHMYGNNGYPKSYVDSDKAALDQLGIRWTTSFSLENTYYLTELQENGSDPHGSR